MSRSIDVDPLTAAQWMGVFACKFVPDEATKKDHKATDGRKFHCKIARQSYLPLITSSIIEHYFENPQEHQQHRISFEMLVPPLPGSSGAGGGEGNSAAVFVPVQEYYPLAVLVDSILGKRDDVGVITFQFRLWVSASPDNPTVLAFPISSVDRMLFLNIHQQLKATCVSLYGSIQCIIRLEPSVQNLLDDALRQNDVRSYYYAKNAIVQNGLADVAKNATGSLVSDVTLFVFHKDGAHTLRAVSTRHCPTLGHALKACVACFETMELDEIDNKVADSVKYASVLLTGVEPGLATPIDFLRDHLSCPDMAVHVTIWQSAESTRPRHLLPQVDWKTRAAPQMMMDGA